MSSFTTNKGGEIITLSFGPHSNWTSRCFWELQERHHQLASLRPSSDVRDGGGQNETSSTGEQLGVASQARQSEIAQIYSAHGVRREVHFGGGADKQWPRALFFDLKDGPIAKLRGGGSSLRGGRMMGNDTKAQEAALRAGRGNGVIGATMAARSVWGGDVMVHRTVPEDPSENDPNYLQHLADIQEEERGPPSSWADRWFPQLHSKSLNELQNYRDGVARFDVFTHGYEVLAGSGSEQTENIFESFRCQLEDCDRVQGFQVFSDCDSGFGGLTQDFLVEFVREEFRSAPILTYGLMDSLTMSNMSIDADGRGEASGRDGSAGVTPLGRGSGGLGGHRGDSTMRARAMAYRSINQGLALSALSDCSDLFVPIHAESLHRAVEATMWSSCGVVGKANLPIMPPMNEHQAASMLAASVDTILLPFRVKKNVRNSFSSSTTTGSSSSKSTMRSLISSIVGRRELNVASLLTRYEIPKSFPNVQVGNNGDVVQEWSDLHEYLSSYAPIHCQGGATNSASKTRRYGADGGASVRNGGGEDSSTGHTAKSMGTSNSTINSTSEDELPCLLWSLSGEGMHTAHSENFQTFQEKSVNTPSVTYGTHAVVRGHRGDDTGTVARHEISNELILDMYIHRTQCRAQNISAHVCNATLAIPTSQSRSRALDEDDEEARMEEEAADLMEREMMRRLASRRKGRHNGRHEGETKDGSNEGQESGNAQDPDWTQTSAFQVEDSACMAVLDVSPRSYPFLRRTAEQLKRRVKSMVFEYEKGTKGVDADQFEEIVESLMSRADAYEQ